MNTYCIQKGRKEEKRMILNYTYNSCCYCWYKIKFMKWIKRIKIEGKSLRLHLCIFFFCLGLLFRYLCNITIYCQFVILLLHFLSLFGYMLCVWKYFCIVCKIRLFFFVLSCLEKEIHCFGKRNITLRWVDILKFNKCCYFKSVGNL